MSNLQQALEKFKKQQLAGSQLLAQAQTKRAAPKREAKPKAGGRGRGRAGPAGGQPVDNKTLLKTATGRSSAVPIGKYIKDVLEHLKAERRPMTPDEIFDAKAINIVPGTELHDELQNHPRVHMHPDGRLEYKALHDLQDRHELLALLRKAPEGTPAAEVKDAYKAAAADIAALRKEGKLIVLPGWEAADDVLYPVDPSLDAVTVDDDIVELWNSVKVPEDPVELEAELRKAGISAAPRKGVRKRVAGAKRERKRREYRPRVVTNVHMPELFFAPPPTQID